MPAPNEAGTSFTNQKAARGEPIRASDPAVITRLRREEHSVEFRTVEDSGVLVIGVSGRLDSMTSPTLEQEVRRQLEAGHARIVFDLAALQYISSAGLRVIILAAREIRGKGAVALAAPTPNVQQVLDIAGVTVFAKIYSAATEAVQALKP